MPRRMRPAAERFWEKVAIAGPDECWLWTAGKTKQGYGGFHPVKYVLEMAHRMAYMFIKGPIPEGMFIDHTCHNNTGCPGGPTCPHRLCCNPDHLEAVTNAVNVNRSHNSNISKTHCPAGHEYTPSNTRLQVKARTTSRKCITCERARDRKRSRA